MRIRMAAWLAATLAFTLLSATAASAQTYTYSIYVDGDASPASGCTVPQMTGADSVIEADVSGGISPQVLAVRHSACIGGSFAPGTSIGGGYPVGLNNGTAGADVIEVADALSSLRIGSRAALRLAVVARSTTGEDELTTRPGGGPILLGLPALPVPLLGIPVLLLLLAAVAFFGARRAKRAAAWRVLSLFLFATSVAIAANFAADGSVADWAGVAPLATDPAGDSTSGESAIDITTFFGAVENGQVFLRIDVRDLQNNPPIVNPTAAATFEEQPVVISLTGSDPEGANITFAVATAPTKGTLGAVLSTGPTSADVTYTPNLNANGADSFTFTANDGQGSSAPATVSITITPVNDAPSFTAGGAQSVPESAGPQAVAGWATAISAGPPDESTQTVNFTVTVTNTTGNLSFSAPPAVSSSGTLTYTPTNVTSGIATVSVVAVDDGGTANGGVDTSAPQVFTIGVNAINHAPSFVAGAAQTVLEDSGVQSVNAWATAIDDGDGNTQVVDFQITNNSNPGLFNGVVAISPTGTLSYTPAANANGSANVTIVLHDNGGSAFGGVDTSPSQTFAINVTAVNDAPSFTAGTSASVLESAGPQTFNNFHTAILAGPPDESGQTLTFNTSVGSTTGSLVFSVAPSVSSTGTLTFTAQAGTFGTANVSSTLMDNGGTANGGVDTSAAQAFTITVNNVNDPPVFTVGPNQSVFEDAGAQTVAAFLTGIADGDDGSQAITFQVSSNNPGLFSAAPAIDPSGTLTYTTALNANGVATVTVIAMDDGGTANGGNDTSLPQQFTLTVAAVNDAPSYTAGANPTVLEDSGLASIANWATSILPGPADESAQIVAFTVTPVSGAALFTTLPSITPTGTLSFQPAADANGVASFNVTLQDNGGTANGGADTSAPQLLTITISAVDDPPVAVADNATVVEDSGANAINVLANDTDIDGGPIGVGSVTQPANGSVAITGGGTSLTYAPNADYCNSPPGTTPDTFTYTLTPGASTATVSVAVTCVDDPPVAVNDVATVTEDSAATAISVLANDTDVDGGPISITSVTQPANGTVVIVGGGTGLTYQPNADYCNVPPGTTPDTFTYTLTPGGSTATVSVSVTCVNDAPVNSVPGLQAVGAAGTITFNAANLNPISTSDIDAGAGIINLAIAVPTPADGSINLANIGGLTTILGQGSNSVTATGTLAAINASLDGMTYTAPAVVPAGNPVLMGITVDDNGNTGTGGSQSDTDVVPISIDNPPSVTASTPANGSVQANNVALSITFSESVNVVAGAVTLTCGGPNLITGGDSGLGVSGLTPTHSVLPNGGSCTMTVVANLVTDVDLIDPPDQMVANYVVNFTVDAAPAVISTVPASAATVATDATITLNFSEAVNLSATAFTLNCGAPVTVNGLPANNVTSVVLTPTTALPGGATCNATVVAAQVTDFDSIDPPDAMLANYNFSFSTDAAPSVTAFTPANGSIVSSTPVINVSFSENVDLTTNAFTLLCNAVPVGFSSVPPLPATGTTTLAVTPTGPLAFGAACVATVVALEVDDSDTIDPPANLVGNVTRSFSVDAAPSVLSTTPVNGASNVVPNSNITVNFSESVQFDTTANAANTSFDLECPGGTPANFTVLTASPATSVVLNPDDNAIAGQTCTLTVRANFIADNDAIDPPDNMVADFVASFSFGSLANDDAYNVTPHLTLSSAAGAAELDANDILGAGVLTSFGFGSCNGTPAGSQLDAGATNGRLFVAANGAFSYEPPAGVSNTTRTFCYTVTGGDTANVVFTIQNTELVWFVDAAAAAGGVGNQARPFQTLAAAAAVDTANDTIYLASNAGNYTAGITLETAERLIGDGASSNLATITGIVPATGSAFPTFSGTAPILTCAADCVTLAGAGTGNNNLRGFTVANSATDIAGTNFGTLTASEVTLNGTGRALNLDTGALSGSLLSTTSTSSPTQGLLLQNVTGTFGLGNTGIAASTTQGILVSNSTADLTFGATTVNAGTDGISLQTGTGGGTRSFSSATVTTNAGIGLLLANAGNVTISTGSIASTNRAAIDATGANALNVTLTSATSTNSTGKGINLDGAITGTLTINGGSISGSTAEAFDLNLGTAAITYAGSISKTLAGRLIDITGRTGGTATLSGNLSSTGTSTGINVSSNTGGTMNLSGTTKTLTTAANAAVTLATNTGATVNFTGGGLAISTTSGAGFNATGGGTISVQGAVNTITSTTGRALNVASTTIGASGLTFQSISANGAPNGILLNTTGGSGGLTVTGTGVAGSGGTIQNSTAVGVSLVSTSNVSLAWMNINSSATDGINGASVAGFGCNRCSLLNNGSTTIDEGMEFTQLTGVFALTNSTFTNSAHNHVFISNTSGTVSSLSMASNTFNANSVTTGNHAVLIEGLTAAPAFTTISFTGNNVISARSIGLQLAANNSTSMPSVTVTGNTFTNNVLAVDASLIQASNMTFNISTNTINTTVAAGSHALNSNQGIPSTGTVQGRFDGNIIGTAGSLGSGSPIGNGYRVVGNDNGTKRYLVTNSTIRETRNGRGIEVVNRNGTGGMDATVTNNNVNTDAQPANFPLSGIIVQANCAVTCNSLRADIAGNTVAVPPGDCLFDLSGTCLALVRSGATSTCQLVDRPPTGTPTPLAEVTANNPGSTSNSATATCTLIPGPITLPP